MPIGFYILVLFGAMAGMFFIGKIQGQIEEQKKQEKKFVDDWAEMHGAVQNRETGKWEV